MGRSLVHMDGVCRHVPTVRLPSSGSLQSSSTACRDWPTVLSAVQAVREGRDEDAVEALQWSDAEIQKIVRPAVVSDCQRH